jgi:hypothetical protein
VQENVVTEDEFLLIAPQSARLELEQPAQIHRAACGPLDEAKDSKQIRAHRRHEQQVENGAAYNVDLQHGGHRGPKLQT